MKNVNPIEFVKLFKEIQNHHAFILNLDCSHKIIIDIEPTLVDPNTNAKNKDSSKNTKLVYWAEVFLPVLIDWSKDNAIMIHGEPESSLGYEMSYDNDLATSADSYEECVIKIHQKMTEKYGHTSQELIDQRIAHLQDTYENFIDNMFKDLY